MESEPDIIRTKNNVYVMDDSDRLDKCIWCECEFEIGVDGNELGFCIDCSGSETFPYDLDKYYKDLDEGKTIFKGFDTMERGILEPYKKWM